MRRFFIVLLVLGLFGWVFWSKEAFASRFLSKRLGCRVEVTEVCLRPTGLLFRGVSIENPPTSHFPYALEGGVIRVDFNLLDLRKKTVPIEQVRIEGGTVGFELTGLESNWNPLLQTFAQHREGKAYKVEKLIIKNIHFRGHKKKSFLIPPLPYLELENIGTPVSLGQLSRIAFQATLATVKSKASPPKVLESLAPLPPSLVQSSHYPLPKLPPSDNKVICQGVEMFKRSRNIFS